MVINESDLGFGIGKMTMDFVLSDWLELDELANSKKHSAEIYPWKVAQVCCLLTFLMLTQS